MYTSNQLTERETQNLRQPSMYKRAKERENYIRIG